MQVVHSAEESIARSLAAANAPHGDGEPSATRQHELDQRRMSIDLARQAVAESRTALDPASNHLFADKPVP